MRILVIQALHNKGIELIENFEKKGHAVWGLDWRRPDLDNKVRNFIWEDPRHANVLKTIFKFIRPEEVHNIVSKSIQANVNIILASTRVRKLVFYFEEPHKSLDQTAKLWAEEFGIQYESKNI